MAGVALILHILNYFSELEQATDEITQTEWN